MARKTVCAAFVAALGVATACPAVAQFGSIFGRDPAPRPPSEVPNRPSQHGIEGNQDTGLLPPGPPPSQRGGIRGQPLPPPPGGVQSDPEPLPPPQPQQGALLPSQSQPQLQPPGLPPAQQPGLPPGQRQPRGGAANTAPQPGDEVVTETPGQKITNPTAVFAGLDKVTGRIISFDVAIDETVQFGALQVTPRMCYSRPPTETQQTDVFVEVDEVTLQGEIKRIFTGWMFASSPGLHGVEHSIYDVWLTNCKGGATTVAATPPPAAPDAPAQRPARRQQTQQPQPRAQGQQPGQQQLPAQQSAPQPQFQTLQPIPAQPGGRR